MKAKNPNAPAVTRLADETGNHHGQAGAGTFEPVTPGRIRSYGCRDLLVYCISGAATTRCGMLGADVRPGGDRMSRRGLRTQALRALLRNCNLT